MLKETDSLENKNEVDYPLPVIKEVEESKIPSHIITRIQNMIENNAYYNDAIKYSSYSICIGNLIFMMNSDYNTYLKYDIILYIFMSVNFLIWGIYTLLSESFVQVVMNKCKLKSYNEVASDPEHNKNEYCSQCIYNIKNSIIENRKDPCKFFVYLYILSYTITSFILLIYAETLNKLNISFINLYMISSYIQYVNAITTKIREFNYQYV